MEGKLIFCLDAIMRYQSDYDKTTAVPLLSILNVITAIKSSYCSV